ncbi:MAG: bi-domain-containing oxidoreductase [Fibrobacteria bacterium]
MQQIIQSYRTGNLELAEVPIPECGENGLLVRTACSLVSAGTEKMVIDLAKKSLLGKAMARPDLVRQVWGKMKKEGAAATLSKVFTKLDNPIPLGYSCAGQVIAVGRNVSRFVAGDWVACAGAGYANHSEVNYVPQNLAAKVPEGLGMEAACFATVGSIALQGVRQAQVELGHRVGVIGLGLLGQMTVQILKASGAKVLCMDIAQAKMDLARKLGADFAVHADNFAASAKNLTEGYGLDSLIITASTSSNHPIELAGEVCRYKGKVVVVGAVGMNIPRDDYYRKELDIRLSMSYGPGRYDPVYEEKGIDYPYSLVRWTEGRNLQAFLELCSEGKLTPVEVVTHRFPFEDALQAYELFEGKTGEPYLGILLKYDADKPLQKHVERRSGNVAKSASAGDVRVGLVGAGGFAKSILLPRLVKIPGTIIASIATATGASAKGTSEKYGIGRIFGDVPSLLQDPSTNAVLITTRHNHHAEAVLAALDAGKHVFVEKPLCIREEELLEIRNRYEAMVSRPVLTVGFNRRFSSHAVELRKWIEGSGEMPVIRYRINAGYIPGNHWTQDPEIGGGRIIGEACHFLDLCAFLAGAPAEEVFAASLETPGEYRTDNVCITVKHANGARSSIDYLANGDPACAKERIEVFCGRGLAESEDFRVTTFHKGGKRRKFKSSGIEKGFEAELLAFCEAVKGRVPEPIPFSSLVNTTLATFRILESISTGSAMKV